MILLFVAEHRLVFLVIRHSFLIFIIFAIFLAAITSRIFVGTVFTVATATFGGHCVGLDHFEAILFRGGYRIVFFNIPTVLCFWPAIVIYHLSMIAPHITWTIVTRTIAWVIPI